MMFMKQGKLLDGSLVETITTYVSKRSFDGMKSYSLDDCNNVFTSTSNKQINNTSHCVLRR